MKNYIFIKLNYIETTQDESFYNKLLFRHICEIRCTMEFKIVYNGVIVSILRYNIRLTSFVLIMRNCVAVFYRQQWNSVQVCCWRHSESKTTYVA